ncbi:MAG: LacI family DNA-binding transcriptional regulator, partial [Lentisphaeria bacterium]|nr:LacI family DNA-binding transcriptional regulator [Lentisphaeria bacterium]
GKVFRRQLELSGVSSAEQLVSYSEGKHDAGLERRIDSLLEQGITALTVIPGESTLKILNYLNRQGIRIPKDLSVVTREIPGILDCWDPPLTAYEPDYTAHLERAVDLIEAHYNHQSLKNIAIPGRLIERGSVRKI